MEVGLVRKVDIDQEMQQAYLDYAMSVIVARALPDARDGLKPVHRRILYAMHTMGLHPNEPFKKSARIVGEVLGKYHPHGDMAVYDAMARMAQDFSLRYPLVEGQGNFGSVDGDAPAAMRYTEARLAPLASYLLADIEKNTVNFIANFDGTLTEPEVLPTALPNLLVNGTTGIAVGMATSIPPHNLSEVVDALIYMLENWESIDDISVEDLMRFIKGPDFPTGGIILQSAEEGLASAYGYGRGRITVRARALLEELDRGRSRIIVTELPYLTNKSSLIERIAKLVRDQEIEGITDLRDESDRQGMRIVIELSRNADPDAVLRDLFKHTPMQSTFSINLLALVDGEPRLLSLKQALRVYLKHRLEVTQRRIEYDLAKAEKRAHILEGLRIALKNLDEVITIIRHSQDAETARTKLMRRFKLTEIQAQAILDMPLRRLASLERKKIEEEYKEVTALIKELKTLLRLPKKMRQLIIAELRALKEAHGDRRRTHITPLEVGALLANRTTHPAVPPTPRSASRAADRIAPALLTASELIPDQMVWVSVSSDGLISRSLEDEMPRQSGSEAPRWLVHANTRDTLYLVAEDGQTAAVTVHALPQAEKPSAGQPLDKVSPLPRGTSLAAIFTLPKVLDKPERHFVLSVSRQGMVKKSAVSELPGPAARTFLLAKVNEGDRLGWVRFCKAKTDLLLVTAQGMAIRFGEEEVRPMGLMAAGVGGIKLAAGDEIIGVATLPTSGEVFMVASDGKAKRVDPAQFPRQKRFGQGVTAWKASGQARLVGMVVGKGTAKVTLHLKKSVAKSLRLDSAPLQGRATQGKVILPVKAGDEVLGITTTG